MRALLRPLDVLVPPVCAGCGLPGEAVCEECRTLLVPLPPICARCGHPWPISVARCAECPASLDVARQATGYHGPAAAVVPALKDGRRRTLAGDLADLMVARIPPPPAGIPLVPVPIAAERLLTRGFNQAELLARALATRWGREVALLLRRIDDSTAQRGATAAQREEQVRGAFRLRPGTGPPPAVCLVDDVVTTGATLTACARVLRRAGARRVGAVAFARTVRAPRDSALDSVHRSAPGGPDGSSRKG